MQTINFLYNNIHKMNFVKVDIEEIETFHYQDSTGYYEIKMRFDEILLVLHSKFGFEAMKQIF